jgi:hypothetical protein
MLKFFVIAVLTFSAVAYAQELPAGEGAWLLRVVTRGGIAGTGRGNFTISSDGRLTCSRPGCPDSVSEARVRRLAR